MALETYKAKRNFNKTKEPTGGKPTDNRLLFVVQKHHASHLHYDFRLELRGVLKSWAVPKGLSMNPSERRLAMETEDHPWDYRDFEGIIPKGQYGGGTVIVWDEGTYQTTEIEEKDKKSQEHSITSQYWKGQIKFILHGHKLKGAFALTKAKEKGDNSWYIQKLKDQYATKDDITLKDKSVISKKTVEEMAADPDRTWQSNKGSKKAQSQLKEDVAVAEADSEEDNNIDLTSLIKKGKKAAMPAKVEPMACTLIKEPFTDPQWIYELKLDGYRIIGTVKKGKVVLSSRSGLNYTSKYPPVVEALKELKHDVIIDGEVAVLDEDGKTNFDKLQKYKGNGELVFYAFDLLWIDGYDVTRLDLLSRKEMVKQLFPEVGTIRYTDHVENGAGLFEQTKKLGLEGIVAKRIGSVYEEGKRSKDWLKLPTEIRQEFVIGGWTESESGKPFRSILFGAYENGKLNCIGHAGGGYKDAEMPKILAKLKKLEIKKSPYANDVDAETTVHYVKPELVANFKFATWTASGKIRKPAIFLGFREDKDPKDVVREVPLSEGEEDKTVTKADASTIAHVDNLQEPTDKPKGGWDSNWRDLEKQEITSKDSIEIEGKDVALTNIEKELWSGITKADLIQYYNSIADYILPYLRDRPLSLHIKHIKPTAPGLYIKDMEGNQPEWAEVFSTRRKNPKKGKRSVIDYLVCQDRATLLYMVNLGCIDINPWTSRTSDYLHPDFIIIDLDPTDDDFNKVIDTTLASKEVFDKLKIKAFPKTSGKTGIHLYIPCEGFTFPEARTIAVKLSTEISSRIKDIATSENTISKRGDKVFVDYNQNDEADTVAAPYSVRPAGHPTVSTPLEWKEINNKLHLSDFDMHNILQRIKKKGDLFVGVMDAKVRSANSRILKRYL